MLTRPATSPRLRASSNMSRVTPLARRRKHCGVVGLSMTMLAGLGGCTSTLRASAPSSPITSPAPTDPSAGQVLSSSPSEAPAPLAGPGVRSAQVLPGGHGYVLEEHGLFWTDDAGGSWKNVTPPGVSPTALNAVAFLPDGHIWTAQGAVDSPSPPSFGPITISRRAPNGMWSSSTIGHAPVVNWFGTASLSFIDPAHGWLLIDTGSHAGINFADLYRTADGGATWSALTAPASGTLAFLSTSVGYIDGGQPGPNLYATHDGGATWSAVLLPLPADRAGDLVAVLGVPTTASGASVVAGAWVDPTGDPGGFGMYASTDNGASWKLTAESADSAASYVWAALPGGAAQTIVRNGEGPESYARSGDSGGSFSTFAPAAGLPSAPLSISAASVDTLWGVVQVNGCREFKADCFQSEGLFRSVDGGGSWHQLALP